ncbi:MAG: hypothetical protein ABH863_05705 [Candidatus Micrarchaeota archaeon]
MTEEFVMLQSNLQGAQFSEILKGKDLTNPAIFSLLETTFEAVRKKAYDYAPIDKSGIGRIARQHPPKGKTVADFVTFISGLKPSSLGAELSPFCRDDRNPQRIIEKKLPPVTDIAIGQYLSIPFEDAFPVSFKPSKKPPKNEFRFAANIRGWVIIRKVNLDVAEKKEVLCCLVHTLESIERRFSNFHTNPGFFPRLDAFLARYPSRRSFGKLPGMLLGALAQGLLTQEDPFLNKYALYRLMRQLGYSPYLSGEILEGIYPELKVPKPRGRMKKS